MVEIGTKIKGSDHCTGKKKRTIQLHKTVLCVIGRKEKRNFFLLSHNNNPEQWFFCINNTDARFQK